MLKIKRSLDRLSFILGIPIPGKDGLYIETGPWSLGGKQTTTASHYPRIILGLGSANESKRYYLDQWWPRLLTHISIMNPRWYIYTSEDSCGIITTGEYFLSIETICSCWYFSELTALNCKRMSSNKGCSKIISGRVYSDLGSFWNWQGYILHRGIVLSEVGHKSQSLIFHGGSMCNQARLTHPTMAPHLLI